MVDLITYAFDTLYLVSIVTQTNYGNERLALRGHVAQCYVWTPLTHVCQEPISTKCLRSLNPDRAYRMSSLKI